jgi:hypothetical protein
MSDTVKGWHSYKGTTILQHDDIESKVKKLFETIKPSQVLEIGTSYGGLTLLIRDVLNESDLENSDFRTYDVLETQRYWLEEAIKEGAKIDFRIKNVFNQPYSDLADEHVEEISSFIQQSGPTIVMCDGGSKKNEFNILSRFLKSGDIIMAHDYSPNAEYFENNINGTIWNWHEIEDSHIQDCVEKYGLEPFMQEDFQQVVWVCKKKK